MASETLPNFKYHPDPIATGSIERSATECVCCGKARGYIYTGPVYSAEDYDESICPWCIGDGSAHRKLDVSFHDEAGVGGDMGPEVSEEIVEEIAFRTPGFSGWQQEQWATHCDDGAQFLGRAGHDELTAAGEQAIAAIQESAGLDDGEEWEEFFEALDKDNSPTAYLFKCIKCGKFLGYQDCD